MASLGTMYGQALKAQAGYGAGWIPHWPLQDSNELGRVADEVYSSDHEYSLSGQGKLKDYGIKTGKPVTGAEQGSISATHGTIKSFDVGLGGSTPGLNWLGNAEAGASVSFGDDGGFRLDAYGLQRSSLPDLAALKSSLRAAAQKGRLSPGNTIVIGIETATTVFVVACKGKSGALKLKLKAALQPGAIITMASLAAGFAIQSSAGSATATAFPGRVTTAFQAVTVGRRGIFFWREIPIRILLESGDTWGANLDYAESYFTDEDYFTTFDKPIEKRPRRFIRGV
jgi:hypothetical protein